MAKQKLNLKWYDKPDSKEHYKNILESFHYCDEKNGINCYDLSFRLWNEYGYHNFVLKNPCNGNSDYTRMGLTCDYSSWHVNKTKYVIYIIEKLK